MNKQTIDFLKQTAKDYDMELWKVIEVYNRYGLDDMYQELEYIIANRIDPAYEPKE